MQYAIVSIEVKKESITVSTEKTVERDVTIVHMINVPEKYAKMGCCRKYTSYIL
jgi:hypothetical protein